MWLPVLGSNNFDSSKNLIINAGGALEVPSWLRRHWQLIAPGGEKLYFVGINTDSLCFVNWTRWNIKINENEDVKQGWCLGVGEYGTKTWRNKYKQNYMIHAWNSQWIKVQVDIYGLSTTRSCVVHAPCCCWGPCWCSLSMLPRPWGFR